VTAGKNSKEKQPETPQANKIVADSYVPVPGGLKTALPMREVVEAVCAIFAELESYFLLCHHSK
jgi:hypothetical protein